MLQTINDASIDQTVALDTDLNVISWNSACERATGICAEKAIGLHYTEVYKNVVSFPEIIEALDMALQGFKSFVPWEKGSYDGNYYEHHFIPLKDEDGEVTGVLNIIHDVAHRIAAETDLKRLNKALVLKNKELKRKAEELANFNWVASHDLKEPLRKIYTFIEMAASKEGHKLSDAARSNLRRAQSAVQRMGLVTDDLVTFCEAVAPTETPEEVDLQALHAAAIEKESKAIEESGAAVKTEHLPIVVGYPQMLRHLWKQLLSNALKFHAEGAQPVVNISYTRVAGEDIHSPEADRNTTYHCIAFSDNGIGFAPEYSEKIFGMFQRLHEPGRYKGTGMGLPICRKIAEAHNGFISVQSTEGEGSTFSCYLEDLGERAAAEHFH